MSEQFYEGAIDINLEDYIPVKNFRIIPVEVRTIPGGISEIKVEIKLEGTIKSNIAKNGFIFGFVKMNDVLRAENADNNIKHIDIYDWSNKFVMFINYKDSRKKKAFYTTAKEVSYLIENCLRPNLLSINPSIH